MASYKRFCSSPAHELVHNVQKIEISAQICAGNDAILTFLFMTIIVIIVKINKKNKEKNCYRDFILYDNRNQIYSLQIIGFDCIPCIGTELNIINGE